MSIESTIDPLKAAIATFAPAGYAFEVAVVEDYMAELTELERRWIDGWAPHRQQEFATGRLCARHALSVIEAQCEDLLPDAEGVPRWPEGSVGSISHSRGVAMAIAARAELPLLLGLDLEKTNRLSQAAMNKVVHPLEARFVMGDQVRASILFSLKEAFYKAQFPRWRTAGNFHDMALKVDLAAGVANILKLDARFASELRQLQFRFRLVDDYVVSLCWM